MAEATEDSMRLLVTGIRDGRTCVVEEIDCTPAGEDLSTKAVARLDLDNLPPRPPGQGSFVHIPVGCGEMLWYRVRLPASERRPIHHTDTIDCLTVIRGSMDLVLDDGEHRLNPGDSVLQMGTDHGWNIGPEGCVVSIVILGTPPPVPSTASADLPGKEPVV